MSRIRILICIIAVVVCFKIMVPVSTAAENQPPKKYSETITTKNNEKISFEMVLIPGGSFLMGSPSDEAGRKDHEGPQYKVHISPFYL